ncbi:MAG TPA: trypsin-like peptidase domain-containing protein [Phnomibacter sp.]|nr:trypsin-like peptidase domain-containing protein [Phnomibacter sp.]
MNWKNVFLIAGISAVTSLASVWTIGKLKNNSEGTYQEAGKMPANYASFKESDGVQGNGPIDFTAAAGAATPAVVHIKTKINARTVTNSRQRSPFADLFGDDFGDMFGGPRTMQVPEQRASGSGVVITNDGYIVTNNHVIENADEINVTLANKKSYKAELVGADPSSDLAVLKISSQSLPYVMWGNSDDVKLGQWVLAIGYPWSLDVTVTAGIVSAKARSLGLNSRNSASPVESFIQTDAAVNQGNSGGALVDAQGRLIGINSAIASPTGSYAGYSYAIPVNIVRKITSDLIKFGAVQRAYLGIEYMPDGASEEDFRKAGIAQGEGVYVSSVREGGAAAAGGIKQGDYITAINGVKVTSASEMVEQVANYKPGDKVNISYNRAGAAKTTAVTLKNISGNFDVVKNDAVADLKAKLGADLSNLSPSEASKFGVAGGVRVSNMGEGLLSKSRMQKDFVITSVDNKPVKSVEDLMKILSNAKGTVRLEGIYPGFEGVYGYPLNLNQQGNDGGRQ